MTIKKRNIVNKPKTIACAICHKHISLYALASHIKFTHNMTSDEYADQHGEFRKAKPKPSTRTLKQITCKLCDAVISSVGMFTHLRDSHSTTPDEYCIVYGEYRPAKLRELNYVDRLKTSPVTMQCAICNKDFASGNLLGGHIKRDHKLTKQDYITKYIFNNNPPLCKCGCNKPTSLLLYYPYTREYITGHNKSTEGFKFSAKSRTQMSEKAVSRIKDAAVKTSNTQPELDFKQLLDQYNIQYEQQYVVNFMNRSTAVDFYLPEPDLLIEIDGDYWHPNVLENLSFHLLPNVISDKQKLCLFNLVRIRASELEHVQNLATDKHALFEYLFSLLPINPKVILHYNQKIMNKDYFISRLESKGEKYLKANVWLLLKFIRTFQPEFPYPDIKETLSEVIAKIAVYDLNAIYDESTNEFSNNTSAIGHNYLKHYFHSFWASSFKGNLSPIEAWLDDEIMTEIITYRIGCNTSGEVFDFSLYQLVNGMSARRLIVSFFKPVLGAAIYKHYLGDNLAPVVLDPCCGFGGRLLGFKAVYPKGTYIGCEPNSQTFDELQQLIKAANWTNVEIHNCKFEEFNQELLPKLDLTFTSIPYFDKETYSVPTEYTSYEDWKSTLIEALEIIDGLCLINTTVDLAEQLGWNNISAYIKSNRSHFDKQPGKKLELIVSL